LDLDEKVLAPAGSIKGFFSALHRGKFCCHSRLSGIFLKKDFGQAEMTEKQKDFGKARMIYTKLG
jgi:hypothetical protein